MWGNKHKLDYSDEQIKEKIRNLKRKFSECKRGVEPGESWEYFSAMSFINDSPLPPEGFDESPCEVENAREAAFEFLETLWLFLKRGRQEDSHEFMRQLLTKLEEEFCERFKSSMYVSLTCLKCKGKSTQSQYFSDLVVDLETSVKESVWSYFKPITVAGYACSRCKTHQEATKRMLLLKPPNVLCIQLKSCKVSTIMSMGRDFNYKFLALVEHHGPRPNCGHYSTTAAKLMAQCSALMVSAVIESLLQEARPYYLLLSLT
ncbi:ubiquitin carboxyl-terminal hydrolase 36-like [Frankliniella occidentalis]|uniref:Ubiquitin carboxyl-terminal hydrolase 36 n=1 Tax=Frankliniella occidentalis TaxID=133901 RepID=A0A9C6X876_FRAOC|nr:ubiquitin carboxyl-terminal hydrolase 36-like [Frankliniella occidentalis]